jgi:hypothetical protein
MHQGRNSAFMLGAELLMLPLLLLLLLLMLLPCLRRPGE